MKLYLIAGNYFGTQAEAKPAAAQAGIKASQIGDHEVDVPTDKAGLIDYLNSIAQGNVIASTEGTFARTVGAIPELASPCGRAQHNIAVETEIARADFPNAIRLAEHANQRVAEHLRDIANEASAKTRAGSADLWS